MCVGPGLVRSGRNRTNVSRTVLFSVAALKNIKNYVPDFQVHPAVVAAIAYGNAGSLMESDKVLLGRAQREELESDWTMLRTFGRLWEVWRTANPRQRHYNMLDHFAQLFQKFPNFLSEQPFSRNKRASDESSDKDDLDVKPRKKRAKR